MHPRLIVEYLLEARNTRLQVFGPRLSDDGDFFIGDNKQDVLEQFIRNMRKDAVLTQPGDLKKYQDYLLDQGYALFFEENGKIEIFSKGELDLNKEALAELEEAFGMNANTPVEWNGKAGKAGQLFYGQPGADKEERRNAQKKGQIMAGEFGGKLTDPRGRIKYYPEIDEEVAEWKMRAGMAFVLQFASGDWNVLTPTADYEFSPQAYETIQRMGLTGDTPVTWYSEDLQAPKKVKADDAVRKKGQVNTNMTPRQQGQQRGSASIHLPATP